jgi:aspartyl-tRNA(Asn)/glutamyl-tRNA(Gln) amidotransferase subunit B
MTELPRVMANRFMTEYGLSEYDATQLTQSKAVAIYFEAAVKASGEAKLTSNWITGEIFRRTKANLESLEGRERALHAPFEVLKNAVDKSFSVPKELVKAFNLSPSEYALQRGMGIQIECDVAPCQLGYLITKITDGTISNNAAKQVFDALWKRESDEVDAIIEAKSLKQMSDTGELEAIIDTVLASNTKSVEEYKAGNAKAFNALVGQAMKATKGKGNPAQVNELLKKKLG